MSFRRNVRPFAYSAVRVPLAFDCGVKRGQLPISSVIAFPKIPGELFLEGTDFVLF